ncbi:hypothetical protein KKC06_03640 [Patescibacteria group bacterium]|nr:hypothetical protein [Patescibacteria group bacterium]
MAHRGKVGQTKHDKKVSQRLDFYKERGFRTWADLPNRAKPPKVGGRIPDIYARKKSKLFVEEIETPVTRNTDTKQHQQLRKGTKDLGGKFNIKIAK